MSIKVLEELVKAEPEIFEEALKDNGKFYLYLTTDYINEATDTHVLEGETVKDILSQVHLVHYKR